METKYDSLNLSRATFSNVAATVPDTCSLFAQVGSLNASRVVTLPLAASYGAGFLIVADESGSFGVTNTLVITRAGSDTINGGTTATIITAYGARILICDGISKWTLLSSL